MLWFFAVPNNAPDPELVIEAYLDCRYYTFRLTPWAFSAQGVPSDGEGFPRRISVPLVLFSLLVVHV